MNQKWKYIVDRNFINYLSEFNSDRKIKIMKSIVDKVYADALWYIKQYVDIDSPIGERELNLPQKYLSPSQKYLILEGFNKLTYWLIDHHKFDKKLLIDVIDWFEDKFELFLCIDLDFLDDMKFQKINVQSFNYDEIKSSKYESIGIVN